MKYHNDWDLSTIPESILRSELGRRSAKKRKSRKGGYLPSCTCGKCRTCKQREWQQARRDRLKEEKNADR